MAWSGRADGRIILLDENRNEVMRWNSKVPVMAVVYDLVIKNGRVMDPALIRLK